MTINEKIRDKKLLYDINREATLSALSSRNIDEYEQLIGQEMLPSNQRRAIEQKDLIK